MMNFAEAYCKNNDLPLEAFEDRVMAESLYPQGRLVWRMINFLNPGYFAADRDFVRAVGQLRRARDFANEVSEFTYHPANRGFWRRGLRIRVSSSRLRALVHLTLHPHESLPGDKGSALPFEAEKPKETRVRAAK